MDIVNKVINHFGITNDMREAGYILINGQFLDMSEKNNGGCKGTRTADHRDINMFYEHTENATQALINFMNDGNIRLMPECGGIDITIKPNHLQLSALRTFINYFNGEIILDISDNNGKNLYNHEYNTKTSSSKIISDIINYFEKER
jgi:site-specific recombinase XerD